MSEALSRTMWKSEMKQSMPEPVQEAVQEEPVERIVPDAVYKGRLTVVEQVYHQQYGTDPTSLDSRYSKVLESDEQPYVRKAKVGQDWQLLDAGWVKEASLVVICNDEGRFNVVNPTDQQRAETQLKVVEVSFGGGMTLDILIGPGESARFRPNKLDCIKVRCQNGQCRMSINVYPR